MAMREAFSPDRGPLTEVAAERGEKVAHMELLAGANEMCGTTRGAANHLDETEYSAPEFVVAVTIATGE